MTVTLRGVAVSLQVLGLLGSVVGLAASILFQSYCVGGVYVGAGLLALGLDVVALRASRTSTSVLAACLKPVVMVFSLSVAFSCATPHLPIEEPLLDPSTGPVLLLWSSVPSVLGAFLRGSTR